MCNEYFTDFGSLWAREAPKAERTVADTPPKTLKSLLEEAHSALQGPPGAGAAPPPRRVPTARARGVLRA